MMNRATLVSELAELRIRPLFENPRWQMVCDASFEALISTWGDVGQRVIPLASLDDGARVGHLKGPLAVCTEKPEGPVQQLLRNVGRPSLGLFSQIVPRLAAGLPARYSMPDENVTKVEFAILCSGRCGSTLLSRELRAAGVGKAGEHLRPPVRVLLRHRNLTGFDFARWWELVRVGHTVDGVFGTKIIYGFWLFAKENMTPDEQRIFMDFLGGATIIHLRRRDRVAQAVSDFIANQTRVWHLQKGVARDAYDASAARLEADIVNLLAIHDRYGRHEEAIEALIRSVGGRFVEMDYEDLAADPKGTVARVVGMLGLNVASDYASTEVTLEPTTTEAHLQLCELLSGALRR